MVNGKTSSINHILIKDVSSTYIPYERESINTESELVVGVFVILFEGHINSASVVEKQVLS